MKNFAKRAFDLALATTITPIAIPMIVTTASALALETKSSPLFKQVRIGYKGRPFTIYKIKTMNDFKDLNGNLLPDKDRTGKIGIFIRKSRIDELPQLWNIIKGDMSFVGPRPHIINLDLSQDQKRSTIKPGLTGLGKINGLKHLSNNEELKHDHNYVDHWEGASTLGSIFIDLKILLATPKAIIKHRHAPHSRELKRTL